MALDARELFSSVDVTNKNKRVSKPRVRVGTIAATAVALPALLPMAFNTSTNLWVPWDADGSNGTDTARAFLWEDVAADASDEQHVQLLFEGTLHFDDILAAVEEVGVEVEADLETELRSGPRSLGFIIEGLTQVR